MGAAPHIAPGEPPFPNGDAAAAFFAAVAPPGTVLEMRIPKTKRGGPRRYFGVASGYFDNAVSFAQAAGRIGGEDAEAVYVTVNPVDPALLARSANRLKDGNPPTTTDAQIVAYRHLFVDVDPVYAAADAAGISASLDERRRALAKRDDVLAFVTETLGWPAPIYVGTSGNGGTLLFRFDAPNDEETVDLVRRGLSALDTLLSDTGAKVDATTSNPSRLMKVRGTIAAKGDHIPGRPHRRAGGRINRDAIPVSVDQLRILAELVPAPEPKKPSPSGAIQMTSGGSRSWDIRDVLKDSGIGVAEKQRGGSTVFALDRCLTSADHADGACVIERPDGMLLYVCHHNRCQGKTWHDAKAALRIQSSSSDGDTGKSTDRGGAKGAKSPSGTFGASTTDDEARDGWAERQPLPPESPRVPTLPIAMVPAPLREWIVDLADLTKLPVEMIATPAITAAGAVVGRNLGIRPGRFDDFVTVPNLWGAIIARPGWLKSAAVKEGFRPINRLVAAAIEAFTAAERDAAVARERIGAEIDAFKARMRESAKKDHDLAELEAAMRAKREELREATPKERRYLTHDATVEKLGELLRDNPRGLLILRDELSGWMRNLDKAGREGDREFFLEAWNGTGSYTTDRIGRGTIHIPALTISVFGGIQPGKLRPLIASAVDGGAGDDGLLQRLQLTVWPDRLPPWKKPERWPDAGARDKAAAIYAALDAMDPGSARAATDADIPYLTFTPAAQLVADRWRDELEHRLRSDELDHAPAFGSHLAKYRSLMPELALIFSLIDIAAGTPGVVRGAVGEGSVRLAAAWCEFLEAHARKLYAAELDRGTSAAHALAAKIAAGAVIDGQPVRDIYRNHWTGIASSEAVLAGLTALADLGWLRVETVTTSGRPAQVVRLHPDLRQEEHHG